MAKERILVVDDEDIIRSMTFELLTDLGYNVILAEDGEQGIDIYRKKQQSIDLVILDMVMPKLNGKECFYEMRAINPDVKVLLSSGFARNASINSLKYDGLYGFIKKPYNLSEISQILHKAIGK